MKRYIFPLACTLLVAGCGRATAWYALTIDLSSEEQKTELIAASMRVIERRLSRLGETLEEKKVLVNDGDIEIRLEVANDTIAEILTDELTAPFTLRIMREAPAADAVILVEGHGGFAEAGITEKHLQWVNTGQDAAGKGSVTLLFSEEGRELMRKIFRENKGKNIGLFVRGKLVSKLLVDTDEVKDDIVITDIPSAELASTFADDVNVGLHVTFTPQS